MDEFWQIWDGQLLVGLKDLGPAVIWSPYDTTIPPISSGNLEMTCMGEYDDLWSNILESKPCILSWNSLRFIQGKTVSVFTITSHTPEFLQLTQELTQTHKPRILTGEVINPGQQLEIILAPHCPELQSLGLKDLPDAFHPSLIIIFVSTTSVKSSVNVNKEESICEFTQVCGDITSCDTSEKNMMVGCGETKNKSEHKNGRNKNSHKKKGKKYRERKSSTDHTRTIERRNCKELVNMSLVELAEKKEEVMKMHGKQYSENDKELERNGMYAKGYIEPEDCSGKTNMLSHVDVMKDLGKSSNNIVCADKASCNVSAEICICKNSDLGNKDQQTVVKTSFEGQQPSGSDKPNMLDTKKFNEFFLSKDTSKPDFIKPSMLKKNLKKNNLKGNIKQSSHIKKVSVDCVIPDLLKDTETLDKSNKDENKPLKREDQSSYLSVFSKDLQKDSLKLMKCSISLQRLFSPKKYEKSKKEEKLGELTGYTDGGESEVKNVEMNISLREIICDDTSVVTAEDTLKEKEKNLGTLQFPSCRASELLETDINQIIDKLRDSVSLGQFENKLIANKVGEENKDICIKTKVKTNKVYQLITDLGLKRMLKETNKAGENMCSPSKKARVVLKDILKGSDRLKMNGLQDTINLNDLKDKTCYTTKILLPSNQKDAQQSPCNPKFLKEYVDFESRNVCGKGSLQESCKRKDTEQFTDEFQQFSSADKTIDGMCFIDYVKEENSIKQELSLECESNMNMEEKRSKPRVKVHAVHTDDSLPDALGLQTELNELQNVQEYPLDFSIHSDHHPSQPSNLGHAESDLRLTTPGRGVTKPIDYMDTSLTFYPKIKENEAFGTKDFESEIFLHENCKAKDIKRFSDELEYTCADESMDETCFIDHIKEPDSVRLELLMDYTLDVNEGKKSEISVKEHVRDSVHDTIKVNTDMNELIECKEQPLDLSFHRDHSPQVSHLEQQESQRIVSNPQCGVDVGTKGIYEEMLLHNLPSSAAEKQLVDATIPTASIETVSLDCKPAMLSLIVKEREQPFTSNHFPRKTSSLSPPSLNSDAEEKTMDLLSETAKFGHIQKATQLAKSPIPLYNESSCLDSEVVSKMQESLNEIDELVSGLREDKICKEGRLMQNLTFAEVKSPTNICMPTEVAKEMISHKFVTSHDFQSEVEKSVTLTGSPGFDINPFKQKECDVEPLIQKMNSKIQAYMIALMSPDMHSSFHDGIKTLADFIEAPTTATLNIKYTAPVTDKLTIKDQKGKNISSQQLNMFIIQQLTKLHAPNKIENLVMTPHSSEVDALCKCQNLQKSQHSPQQLDCQNGTLCTCDVLKYFMELVEDMRGNVSSFKGRTGSWSLAECKTRFTSNQQIDLCQRKIVPKMIMFTPNDIYRPSWRESHSCKLDDECLQMQRYIHLFKADQQDIVKLKCLLVVHDMSYATLEEIERSGGNIYIRPSAVDQLLAHPVLTDICLLPHVQFGVYNSLLAVLSGGAKPILKSKWLLLVHHTAMLDESLVKILQELLKNEDFNSHHHDRVFIPILSLKTCIHVLENSPRILTREQELCDILQRNMTMLIQCIMVGVAQIIGGESYWASLSPESPITDFLMGLEAIHRCLQFVHRHTAVLVGDGILDNNRTMQNSFYNICTVSDMMNANLGP